MVMRIQVLDSNDRLIKNYKTLKDALEEYSEELDANGFRANRKGLVDYLELSNKRLYVPESNEVIKPNRMVK